MTKIRAFEDIKTHGLKCAAVLIGEYSNEGYLRGVNNFCKKNNIEVFFSTIGRRDKLDSDTIFSTGPLRSPKPNELNSVVNIKNLINFPLEAGFDLVENEFAESLSDKLGQFKTYSEVRLPNEEIEFFRLAAEVNFKNQIDRFLNELAPRLNGFDLVFFIHAMAGGNLRHEISVEALIDVLSGKIVLEDFFKTDFGSAFAANVNEVSSQSFKHFVEKLKSDERLKTLRYGFRVAAFGFHGTKIWRGGGFKWTSLPGYFPGRAKMSLEKCAEHFYREKVLCSVFNAPEVYTPSSKNFPGIDLPGLAFLGRLIGENILEKPAFNQRFFDETKVIKLYNLSELVEASEVFFSNSYFQNASYENWPGSLNPELIAEITKTENKVEKICGELGVAALRNSLSNIIIELTGEKVMTEAAHSDGPIFNIGHDTLIQMIK